MLFFEFYARVWFFSVFRRFWDHFIPKLTIIEYNSTLYGHPQVTMPVEGRKNRRSSTHSRPRTVRGES